MATVYRATQESLKREVALKVMSAEGDVGLDFEERFIHEGHDLASLQHHNIATIYDIGHTKENYYYAMELLRGGSLADRLKKGITLIDAFHVIIQIGGALECAHQNNIIHRDLKPSNILFRDYTTPILTDFGIAKNIDRDTHLTRKGDLLGTPSYMSPEQCLGRNIDGRSDQYSLCILFYELITGYLPFEANDSIAVATMQVTAPTPQLPDHLKALQPVINIALDKDPDQRYTSVGEFCRVLEDQLTTEKSLQGYLHQVVHKMSSGDITTTNYEQMQQTIQTMPDLSSPRIPMQTEDEFWDRRSRVRRLLLPILGLSLIAYGGIFYYEHYYPRHFGQELASQTERFIPVLMRQAERQVAISHLLDPPGNNARETLMKVIAMDPDYRPALQMLDDVATTFEIHARDFLAAKDFANVEKELNKGFLFSENHAGLLSVQKLLEEALAESDKQQTIKKKLTDIESYYKAKAFIAPANQNAMVEVNKVLLLDPEQPKALAYKQSIEKLTLARLDTIWRANKISELSKEIDLAQTAFPNNERLAAMRVSVDKIIQQRQDAIEVARLLEQGEKLIKQRRYFDPVDKNALDALKKALALAPYNKKAIQQLTKLAGLSRQQAERYFQDKKYSEALLAIDNGLRARENNVELLALKKKVIEKIVTVNDTNQKLFSKASALVDNGQIVTPPNENAFDTISKILTENPDYKAAQQLMNSLPARTAEQVIDLLSQEKIPHAETTYSAAVMRFPKDKILADLRLTIAEAKANYGRQQTLANKKQQLETALDNDVTTLAQISEIINIASEIYAFNAKEHLIEKTLDQVVESLSDILETVDSKSRIDELSAHVNSALKLNNNHEALVNLARQVETINKQITETEIARLDALKVDVKINARPWAELVRVMDMQGREIPVQGDRHTPMALRLLPGEYQLVLTNPAYDSHQSLSLSVSKGNTNSIDVVFENLTAEKFFKSVDF